MKIPSLKAVVSAEEWQLRVDLAAAATAGAAQAVQCSLALPRAPDSWAAAADRGPGG